MLPVVAYHMESDLSFLECILDDDSEKDGWHYSNLPVPIHAARKQCQWDRSNFLVTASTSQDTVRRILARLFALNAKRVFCCWRGSK